MNETIAAIATFIGGSTVATIIMALINRRRAAAETRKSDAETRKSDAETEALESSTRREEVAYYQKQLDKTTGDVEALKELVSELEKAIATAQNKYEQRVGQLHGKIDTLATELARANKNLDTANATIAELRQEVKAGNTTITDLKDEITQLLVDRAEKKGD